MNIQTNSSSNDDNSNGNRFTFSPSSPINPFLGRNNFSTNIGKGEKEKDFDSSDDDEDDNDNDIELSKLKKKIVKLQLQLDEKRRKIQKDSTKITNNNYEGYVQYYTAEELSYKEFCDSPVIRIIYYYEEYFRIKGIYILKYLQTHDISEELEKGKDFLKNMRNQVKVKKPSQEDQYFEDDLTKDTQITEIICIWCYIDYIYLTKIVSSKYKSIHKNNTYLIDLIKKNSNNNNYKRDKRNNKNNNEMIQQDKNKDNIPAHLFFPINKFKFMYRFFHFLNDNDEKYGVLDHFRSICHFKFEPWRKSLKSFMDDFYDDEVLFHTGNKSKIRKIQKWIISTRFLFVNDS